MSANPTFVVIRGRVSQLRVQAMHVNPLGDDTTVQLSGVLAVLQAAFAVPGAVHSAQVASYEGDLVKACSFTLNDQTVVGYFWAVGFKEGDEVEVVGRARANIFEAIAVARTSTSRLMWIRPHHLRAPKAFARWERRRIAMTILALNVVMLVAVAAVASFGTPSVDWKKWMTVVLPGLLGLDVLTAVIQRSPSAFKAFSVAVEAVGRALRVPNPELLDLPANNLAARKRGEPAQEGAFFY